MPDGRRRTVADLTVAGQRSRVFFDIADEVPFLDRNRGDLWVGPMMLLAMRLGEPLRLADPVSASRRAHLEQVQSLMVRWYPDRLRPVQVRCPEPDAEPDLPADPRLTATCFTGGTDSFATLLRSPDRIGALVYAGGLDISLHNRRHLRRARDGVEGVAQGAALRSFYVATNIKDPLRGHVRWRWESTSSVLASLGTLLSPVVSTLLIPATYADDVPFGFGSHPELDPLWTTDRLRVEHDGADLSRSERVRLIVDSPLARQHLRVCWAQHKELNCGRCGKCLRTMAVLSTMGRLEDFATFTRPLDLELLADLPVGGVNDLRMLQDTRDFARRYPGNEDLVRTLDAMIERYDDQLDVLT